MKITTQLTNDEIIKSALELKNPVLLARAIDNNFVDELSSHNKLMRDFIKSVFEKVSCVDTAKTLFLSYDCNGEFVDMENMMMSLMGEDEFFDWMDENDL